MEATEENFVYEGMDETEDAKEKFRIRTSPSNHNSINTVYEK
jgi:hypothetical protein